MPTSATREQIFKAAYDLAVKTTGVKTRSRRLKTWNEVPPADQPALFFVQKSQHAEFVKGKPTKWTFTSDIMLYVNSGGEQSVIPATQINAMVDALEAVFKQDTEFQQTLGGLVSHCAISGEIVTDEGTLGDQGVAIIPIEIVAV